jgi:hypothetical protein
MGAFKVAGVDGGTGAFEADGRKYTSNSGALIFGPHTPGAVRAGDVALGYDSLLEKTYLGRVTKVDGDRVSLRYLVGPSPMEKQLDQVIAPAKGVAPLGLVAYPDRVVKSEYDLGLVVAVEGEKVWLVNAANSIEVVEKASVKPVVVKTSYKAGDRVMAFEWGSRYQPGSVEKVLEPDFLYSVAVPKIGGGTERRTVMFGQLTPGSIE